MGKCRFLVAGFNCIIYWVIQIFQLQQKILFRNRSRTEKRKELSHQHRWLTESYVITQGLGVNRIMELRERKFLSRAKNIIAKRKMNFERTWQVRNARWMFKLAAFRGKWNFWCQSKLGKPCVFTEMVQNVMLKYIFCTWSFNDYPSFIYRMHAYIQKGVINEKTWFK